jgi:hypothetical protein
VVWDGAAEEMARVQPTTVPADAPASFTTLVAVSSYGGEPRRIYGAGSPGGAVLA